MNNKVKKYIPYIRYGAFAILIAWIVVLTIKVNRAETIIETETEYIMADTLSEWDLFTMALMKVESNYDSSAVSSAGAVGYFQITPIYVKEVNRIHKTDYKFEDVNKFNEAYEVFDLMQQAHNPDYNIEKALNLHNGNHAWYHKRVRKEMEQIRKYEELRTRVKTKSNG